MTTADSGARWTAFPVSNLPHFADFATPIHFVDPMHGWAAIDAGLTTGGFALYGTADGGAHWTPLYLPELT